MPVVSTHNTGAEAQDKTLAEIVRQATTDPRGPVATYSIRLMYRDRQRNTYGTVPGCAITLKTHPTIEEGQRLIDVMEVLTKLFEARGVDGTLASLTDLLPEH